MAGRLLALGNSLEHCGCSLSVCARGLLGGCRCLPGVPGLVGAALPVPAISRGVLTPLWGNTPVSESSERAEREEDDGFRTNDRRRRRKGDEGK